MYHNVCFHLIQTVFRHIFAKFSPYKSKTRCDFVFTLSSQLYLEHNEENATRNAWRVEYFIPRLKLSGYAQPAWSVCVEITLNSFEVIFISLFNVWKNIVFDEKNSSCHYNLEINQFWDFRRSFTSQRFRDVEVQHQSKKQLQYRRHSRL